MPKHTTDVIEFREVGILLKTNREHRIRVVGAAKLVDRVEPPPDKKGMSETLSGNNNAAYSDGSLVGPQEDPKKDRFHPQSPSFVVSLAGDVEFLERDLA